MSLEKKNFLAIGGCPRSGTTALTDLLNLDSQLFICREFRIFRCWKQPIGRKLLLHKLNPEVGSSKIFRKHKLNMSRFEETYEKVNGSHIANYVNNNLPYIQYFGDKLPRFYLYNAKSLSEKFPNMKFIFCLRDGRAVIASQIRLFRSGKSRASFIADSIPNAEPLWLEGISYLKKIQEDKRMAGKFIIVRYEDAVMNPFKTISQIEEFLNLKLNIIKHNYKPVHLNSWKTELPNMMDRISDKFKAELERYNYL